MSTASQQIKIISVQNYQEMSRTAAKIVIEAVKAKPTTVLGLATGSTPIGLYEELILDHQNNQTSYEQISTFNLDEYIGLDENHPKSYARFMREKLFNQINIKPENTHIPSGIATSPAEECNHYETLINQAGGIDLQILGIGTNGHIGFNEPGTPFTSRTHVTELAKATVQANARFFTSITDVPTQSITTGIETILSSKKIVLLANGKDKAPALQALIEGSITEDMPASALRGHQDVTIIADIEALQLLKKN